MRKSIKGLCLGLVCSLSIGMFTGCKGGKDSQLKEIKVWSHDSHSKTVVTELINQFNKERGNELGVKLVYTIKEGDLAQATEMAYASGQGPDFVSQLDIDKNRIAGNIISIEDIEGGKEWIESTYEPSQYDRKGEFKGQDGKVYRLPFGVITFGLVYNKDMFKKYGIVDENGEPTPPTTLAQMREYAKKMTDESKQDYGIILPMKWGSFVDTDVISLLYPTTGMGQYNCIEGKWDFSGLKPILEAYCGMINDHSVFPGSESLDNDTARAYFAERNIAMKFAGSYDVGVFNSQFPAKCDWGVAPLPVVDENNRYKQSMVAGSGYAVSKKTVDEIGSEATLEILKFLYSDELNRKLYQKGMGLPYRADIIEGVEADEGLKGWKEFAELVEVSVGAYNTSKLEITGQKNAKDVILEDVFTGNKSIDAAITELNNRYNEGMETAYKNNPDADKNDTIKKDWNIKIN
ncbi:MAG: ABC transporter substrate-binding protein [Sharpea porci]|uniref:ABC transporter substrate-binding protein n=1 Tax=Sharpea porci TaxID=2652286 RepID=UPI0024090895|nr:ABC transporter substrate-binding protein [Sharpea porci]MDD6710529.1 ABC transporter substrate-binding protein [Sharpea porci]